MNCVIYARYSSDRQKCESISQQVDVCRGYANDHGIEVVGIYADAAQSGTSDDRADFQRMIADARDGSWSCVLVYKLDRFARDRYASAVYKHRLKKYGVSVVSATESIPDTPEGVLLEAVLEGTAEFYSRQLSQNVVRGMEDNARRCMVNGIPPYGYKRAYDGRYAVDDAKAEFIRLGFKMRALGSTIGAVAGEYHDAMGLTYKQAYNIFSQAFKNRRYMGEYSWGGVVIPGGMPAIVTEDEFQAVQKVDAPRRRSVASYPLSGLLSGSDGRKWHGESAQGRSRRYSYYSDGVRRIRCSELENRVAEAIRGALSDSELMGMIAAEVSRIVAATSRETPSKGLLQARKELDNLTDMARLIGADDALASKIRAARSEVAMLERAKARADAASRSDARRVSAWLESFVETTPPEAFKAFVSSIVIDGDGLSIIFSWNEKTNPDGRFVSDGYGTPLETCKNRVSVYPWGLVIAA